MGSVAPTGDQPPSSNGELGDLTRTDLLRRHSRASARNKRDDGTRNRNQVRTYGVASNVVSGFGMAT
jgi:hypothetical protein